MKEICPECQEEIKFDDSAVWGDDWICCGHCSLKIDLDVFIDRIELWLDKVFTL
jgi:hypothetical protein